MVFQNDAQRSSAMACSGFLCFMFICKNNSNFVSLLNLMPLYDIGDVTQRNYLSSFFKINLHFLYCFINIQIKILFNRILIPEATHRKAILLIVIIHPHVAAFVTHTAEPGIG